MLRTVRWILAVFASVLVTTTLLEAPASAAPASSAAQKHCVIVVEKLKPGLDAAVKKGRDGGEGAWLLSLELLQWANAHAAFEDRAVEYAVTFELSPPSWEPPPVAAKAAAGDKSVTFRVKLDKATRMPLHAWFTGANGEDVCGAFYARIKRV